MTKLTKRFGFSASHRLHTDTLTDQENIAVFGKCANPFGHGHNYWLEVTVAGAPDERSGMTLPRDEFDGWVHDSVIDRIDHTYLNEDIEEFRSAVPTTENLALVIEKWLRAGWAERYPNRECGLSEIRIEETPRNSLRLTVRGKSPVGRAAGNCDRSARSEEDGDPGDRLRRITKPTAASACRPTG